MSFPVIKLIGNSTPSPSGQERTREWKIAVASGARELRETDPWDTNDVYVISVGFAFHLGSHGGGSLDVENFIKPTLDGLAAGLFCQPNTIIRDIAHWKYDDSNFSHLFIQRLPWACKPSSEGAAIHVSVSGVSVD